MKNTGNNKESVTNKDVEIEEKVCLEVEEEDLFGDIPGFIFDGEHFDDDYNQPLASEDGCPDKYSVYELFILTGISQSRIRSGNLTKSEVQLILDTQTL